jgi:hypothetical protein
MVKHRPLDELPDNAFAVCIIMVRMVRPSASLSRKGWRVDDALSGDGSGTLGATNDGRRIICVKTPGNDRKYLAGPTTRATQKVAEQRTKGEDRAQ